ncbi:hypothetical protein LC1Hm_2972 [Halomicrobium sp. LC1Hm]|nr:hypothetical protein LC1Hm_2972 [Halomicrobium sp. LC1Hm]
MCPTDVPHMATSSTILGFPAPAVIGFIGVLIGGLLQQIGSYINTRIQQNAQDLRLQSQERIRIKVESLVSLFEQLDETHRILNDNANTASTSPSSLSQADFQSEIKPAVDDYRDTMRKNQIYLDDPQYSDMGDALGQFRAALNYIQWKIQNGNQNPPSHCQMDWNQFKQAYEDATETLQEEINAPVEDN